MIECIKYNFVYSGTECEVKIEETTEDFKTNYVGIFSSENETLFQIRRRGPPHVHCQESANIYTH